VVRGPQFGKRCLSPWISPSKFRCSPSLPWGNRPTHRHLLPEYFGSGISDECVGDLSSTPSVACLEGGSFMRKIVEAYEIWFVTSSDVATAVTEGCYYSSVSKFCLL
jgi:hypothetical protein